MPENDALGLLGLARRAGKLVSGRDAVERELHRKAAHLVILAKDASPGTRRRFIDMSEADGVPVCELSSKEAIGFATGRKATAVLAITDQSFAEGIMRKVMGSGGRRGPDAIEEDTNGGERSV